MNKIILAVAPQYFRGHPMPVIISIVVMVVIAVIVFFFDRKS